MSFSKELRRLTDLPLMSQPVLVGHEIQVHLSNVESPRKIALQPLSNEPDLELLADLLLNLPEMGPSVDCVSAGTIWGANYSEDGQWYRGVVKRVDEKNKKAEICFIDYGNFDMVDIETGLRYLSDQLLNFPPMVFECQWLQASRSSEPHTELNALIDADQPITVKIVETKVPPFELSLTLGTVEDGPVVVIINELLHSKNSLNGPSLDTFPDIELGHTEVSPNVLEIQPSTQNGNGLSPEMGHFVDKLSSFDAALDRLKFLTNDASKQAEKYFKTTETLLSMSNGQSIQLENLIIKMNAMEAEIKDLRAKGKENRAAVIPELSVSSSSGKSGLLEIVLSLGNMLKVQHEITNQVAEALTEEASEITEKYNTLKEENIALRLCVNNAGLF